MAALDNRELATTLAALRFWQRHQADKIGVSRNALPEDDVATAGGTIEPLRAGEIEALCERLNCTLPARQADGLSLLFQEALDGWPAFDTEDDLVNGGDLVEWFSGWRARVKVALDAVPPFKLYTLTTDGENCGIETTAYLSHDGAVADLRANLLDYCTPNQRASVERMNADELQAAWTNHLDGHCSIAEHEFPGLVVGPRLPCAAVAALHEIIRTADQLNDGEAPDAEDYDDTESASSKGQDVGWWEAAQVARKGLAAAVPGTLLIDWRGIAGDLAGALDACGEQVEQMRGMFGDEDGAIARALEAAAEAGEAFTKAAAATA